MTDEQLDKLGEDIHNIMGKYLTEAPKPAVFFCYVFHILVAHSMDYAPNREAVKNLLQDVINEVLIEE